MRVLEVENLSKNYGRLKALNKVSLEIEAGQVFGLLGPNGSGKSTFIGILLNLIKSYQGRYVWFQQQEVQPLRYVGSLFEAPQFYPYLSAKDNLKISGYRKGLSLTHKEIEAALDRVNLKHVLNKSFQYYSLGMKQRLAIAAALVCQPKVVVLDEPTNGLDPQGIAEIRDLILSLRSQKMTVILASHLLVEVEKVCSHVAILKNGHLLKKGLVAEILSAKSTIRVGVDSAQVEAATTYLKEFPGFISTSKDAKSGHLLLQVEEEVKAQDLNEYLAGKDIFLNHLSTSQGDLESTFLEILGNKN